MFSLGRIGSRAAPAVRTRGIAMSRRGLHSSDVVVIGAGMAGASAAFELAQRGKSVTVLEMESVPGFHSTGRSAALYAETYGPAGVRALTSASRKFLESCHEGVFDDPSAPILTPRSVLWVCSKESQKLDHGLEKLAGVVHLTAAEAKAKCPALCEELIAEAFLEPDAMDMDVGALHAGFLRAAKQRGVTFKYDAGITELSAGSDGAWAVKTADGEEFQAKVVVNAAGAWATKVAELAGLANPVHMTPKRRTMIVFRDENYPENAKWPFVMDSKVAVDQTEPTCYFKPEGNGVFWASPADQTPCAAEDVQPDEMDIAFCVDTVMRMSQLNVKRLEARWAGLRTFSPDHEFVLGEDSGKKGFYYLAGLGGYGIQTAPAAARYVTDLITDGDISNELKSFGLHKDQFSPSRFESQ
mmetsp:Transcript_19941/g.37043  ORF Transcript_19941/g.37043 Transcript_19941/m.37043 type:complete len:413 (-) Transcript_19941:603-1841(-)